MRAVQFGSTSENPTNFGANPTRTLGWGLSDGEDYSSPATTTQITITALNDAPVNTVPGAQSVAEDTILPIVGVSVADIDSSALTTTLSVAHGILNVTAGPGVTGNGTASVTITGTAAEINAALAGLAYTGNLNFNGADTLTVATNDGTATDTDTIAITVNPVNDPPALNLDANSSTIGGADYLTAFTDGGPAVAIVDTDVSVIDNDSPTLASATVTLTNPQALDRLTFNGPAPGSIIVAGSIPVTGILTLTGAASAADYQTALRQITFDNTGTNPSTETRIIDVVVNDGTAASNTAHAIVEVIQVNNNAPTLDLDGDNSTLPGTSYRTTFTENGTPVAIADTDTLIGDPDIGSTIASATITLTNPQIGDLLTATLPLPGGITASAYDPVTGTPDALQRRFASPTTRLRWRRSASARLATLRLRETASFKSSSMTEYTAASPRSRLLRSWPSTTPRSTPCRARRPSPRTRRCRSPASRWRTATAARSPPRSVCRAAPSM